MTDLTVVHPVTGETLEQLDQQPPGVLADALATIRQRAEQLKAADKALDTEIRRRLRIRGRKTAVLGDYEAELRTTKESEWDADELEGALRDLVAEGIVQAAEIAEVITRPPVVSRSKAKGLRDRLDGEPRARVDAACSWREKSAKLTLTRSIELLPDGAAAHDGASGHPAAAEQAPAAGEPEVALSSEPRVPLTPDELFA